MTANLFDRLCGTVADPAKIAVETASGGRVSYAALVAWSGRMANALVARGLKPGDRVAVQVEKSLAALVVYLATIRAGGVFLPLNTAYTPAEIDYFLSDSEPVVFVCDPASQADLQPIAARVGAALFTLDAAGQGSLAGAAQGAPADFATVTREPHDLAAMLYTSGTTGRAKGAMLSHDNLASNAEALRQAWRFSAGDVLIHALPIFHTHGLFVASNIALLSGASMVLLPKFDVDQIFGVMARATCLMGVPTFYVRLLKDARLTPAATKHMRLFVSGSAPLLAETHRDWQGRTGHAILERYGMTETNMITSNPYDGERLPGTVGLPLAGVDVRITAPEGGGELARGEIGMIEIKGRNVFRGYWRMPEKTAAEFRDDGFFISGDLGRIDQRGYLHIVGRGKDLIITGGYNVYPKEVEGEIDGIPGVVESAVIGLPHRDFGEAVTAVVVAGTAAALTEAAILDALRPRLARYKLPKRVIFSADLPRNAMGKVQKNLLRSAHDGLYG
ncbi:malonate--CoA ligase [Phreatobacter stygius]|uniref:Malonyl-CoA synthase n=1 Tax=Phreatobacter stygius TaxID=1940610 RepID=A0A4D7B672_9HYPH|nr:malonyl-CoA synthase [Phreatobacter stygius]QCI65206.1 malonyl-CoA synthase [Phreatobacter stygius]